jgi:AcrR family transcriptional regulator
MKRKRRKEHITKERRQQILDAAYEVFTGKGFALSTTAEIARTAGIAEGTIYNYFDNKRDLFTELLKSHLLSDPLAGMMESPVSFDIHMLPGIIESRLGVFFDNAEVLLLLLGEIQRDPELHRQFIEKVTAPGIRLLKMFLDSKIEQGVVRQLNAEIVSRILPAIMIGLTILRIVEGKEGPLNAIPREEMVVELSNFNIRALLSNEILLKSA